MARTRTAAAAAPVEDAPADTTTDTTPDNPGDGGDTGGGEYAGARNDATADGDAQAADATPPAPGEDGEVTTDGPAPDSETNATVEVAPEVGEYDGSAAVAANSGRTWEGDLPITLVNAAPTDVLPVADGLDTAGVQAANEVGPLGQTPIVEPIDPSYEGDFAGAIADREQGAFHESPLTALLDPPPVRSNVDAVQTPGLSTVEEAGVQRMVESHVHNIAREDGQPLDADDAFTAPEGGLVRCKYRLTQTGTGTIYNRPMTTILVGAGALISEAAAEQIKAAIRADR